MGTHRLSCCSFSGQPSLGAGAPGAPAQSPDSNPLAGVRFYVDPDTPAWEQWRAYERSGQQDKADLIWKIAREPRAIWLGRFTRPNFHFKVRRRIDVAIADGSVPIFTVLRAQSTGCGPSYDGGGPAEDARTRAWYDDLARAIGNDRVVIAFEPDSLGTIDCHAPSRRDDRIRLLRYGSTPCRAAERDDLHRGHRVRLGARQEGRQDAARGRHRQGARLHAERDPLRLDEQQHQVRARGLAPDRREALRDQHRRERARADPLPAPERPADQRLVQPGPARPRHPAHHEHVEPMADAYLWINRPGFAQSCQHRPIAWYPARALTYARWATDWERPPAGTSTGTSSATRCASSA